MYKTLLFLALCAAAIGDRVDRTLEPRAHGRDVVETVIYRIHRSHVFEGDRDFLRRVAWTESSFGDDPETYRNGYNGGIWQFDRLKTTQYDGANNAISPQLKNIHAAIKDKMGVNWTQVREEDLLKPFYSGLAARIHIEQLRQSRGPIPDDIKSQDHYWKDWYNTNGGKYGDFWTRVVELLEEDMRTAGGRLDFVAVVDGSSSIEQKHFTKALDSLAHLIKIFDLQEAHVGMVTYSRDVTSTIPLINTLNATQLQEEIRKTPYPAQSTNTFAGMQAAIEQFAKIPAERKERGVPQLMVVFTDGNHNTGLDPGQAAKIAAQAGIITCAFGIGDQIAEDELRRIANDEEEYMFTTQSYDNLAEQMVLIARRAKTVPQTPKMNTETSEVMKSVGEKRYYKLGVPAKGTTIELVQERGEVRGYYTYTSAVTTEQPSSALYDGILTAGSTFIPPPPPPRHRRDLREAATKSDVIIALESIKDDTAVKMKIVEGNATPKSSATKVGATCSVLVAVFVLATALVK